MYTYTYGFVLTKIHFSFSFSLTDWIAGTTHTPFSHHSEAEIRGRTWPALVRARFSACQLHLLALFPWHFFLSLHTERGTVLSLPLWKTGQAYQFYWIPQNFVKLKLFSTKPHLQIQTLRGWGLHVRTQDEHISAPGTLGKICKLYSHLQDSWEFT